MQPIQPARRSTTPPSSTSSNSFSIRRKTKGPRDKRPFSNWTPGELVPALRRLLRERHALSAHDPYSVVSVNTTSGCPSPYGPSAVICTVPALCGSVSTTAAFPDESVVTRRLESVPALAVKNTVAPVALPPEDPAFSVTDRFRFVPGGPSCPSP